MLFLRVSWGENYSSTQVPSSCGAYLISGLGTEYTPGFPPRNWLVPGAPFLTVPKMLCSPLSPLKFTGLDFPPPNAGIWKNTKDWPRMMSYLEEIKK